MQMTKKLKDTNIRSALIMCRPNLKGFFYSRLFEFFFDKIFNFILPQTKALQLGTVHSHLGNSTLIALPLSTTEMKTKNLAEKEKELLKGIELAIKSGAEKIAFAGLIPSLFNHFNHLENKELLKYKKQMVIGQTMTVVGMGVVFEELAKTTNCRILSVVGMGSIGSSSLILLLEKILKPEKIILCDLLKRKSRLQKWQEEIKKTYSIPVEIALYGENSFLKVYEGDMILGAVSSRNILNPYLLKKGAILVDDSFPPIISVRESIGRMKNKKDVLILSGGKMKLDVFHWTSELWQFPQFLISVFLKQMGAQGLPGCWLEALVSAKLGTLLNSKLRDKQNTQEGQTQVFKNHQSPELNRKSFFIEDDILKIWNIKESLDLKLPDFHFFKYNIPHQTVDQVFKLRQNGNLS